MPSRTLAPTNSTPHTYAELRRSVEEALLVVALEVAPGIFVEQKLRLRGLDCPETDIPAGKAAKRCTATVVTVYTSKPDKYDRHLADVFLGREGGGGRLSQQRAPRKRPRRARGRVAVPRLGKGSGGLTAVGSLAPELASGMLCGEGSLPAP